MAAGLMKRYTSAEDITAARGALYSGMIAAMPQALSGLYAQRATSRAAFMNPEAAVMSGTSSPYFASGDPFYMADSYGPGQAASSVAAQVFYGPANISETERARLHALEILKNTRRSTASRSGSYFQRPGGGRSYYGWEWGRTPPAYASGGIVPGRPGEPRVAVVHGGERIYQQGGGGDVDMALLSAVNRIVAILEEKYSTADAAAMKKTIDTEPVSTEHFTRGFVQMMARGGYDLPALTQRIERIERAL
jgi:hypothetical protein